MKILLVDLEYDYGKKSRGINTIRAYGYQAAMESLGHSVDTFFYDQYLDDTNTLQKKVLLAAEESQPDLIFFLLFKNQFLTETLDCLKRNFKTINWFGDDTWRFDNFTCKYAKHFTYSITTDKFSIAKYETIGIRNVIRSQWAAIEKVDNINFSGQYKYDVSFVGAYNPSRAWFIHELAKNNIPVECFGFGWPNGSVDNREMNTIFRHSKINLNLSNSVNYNIRYLLSSPKNLMHTLRSRKTTSQIKARNFEIPYTGGFQLSDYTPSLEDYFTIGKEITCYSTLNDAVIQIQYFLKNNDERESIREASHQLARSSHGYSHRLQQIFKGIGL